MDIIPVLTTAQGLERIPEVTEDATRRSKNPVAALPTLQHLKSLVLSTTHMLAL